MHKNTCKISSWGMVIDIKNPNESWIGVTSNACFKTQVNVSKVIDLHKLITMFIG
jgi:hypothetical protein